MFNRRLVLTEDERRATRSDYARQRSEQQASRVCVQCGRGDIQVSEMHLGDALMFQKTAVCIICRHQPQVTVPKWMQEKRRVVWNKCKSPLRRTAAAAVEVTVCVETNSDDDEEVAASDDDDEAADYGDEQVPGNDEVEVVDADEVVPEEDVLEAD